MRYNRIVFGAGLYGLYAALKSAKQGHSVLVIERDQEPFARATFINQARIHQGYHYPRSLYTGAKTAEYFRRFTEEFDFCINRSFGQIYATSSSMSWSDAFQFKNFCKAAGIPCRETAPELYFKQGKCDGAFITQEYTYDAMILRSYLMEKIAETGKVDFRFGAKLARAKEAGGSLSIELSDGSVYESSFLLNTTYASVNQILDLMDLEPFEIKYELCEIVLCDPNPALAHYGFTVMDGPFFSIMPFGKTGLHSLTSVAFTPHQTCTAALPAFSCQSKVPGFCSPEDLGNCNECLAKPRSAFPYMSNLAHKYLKDEYDFIRIKSLYSMKPILKASEVDDSRPTLIRIHSKDPMIVSVLSGKINTIYDMDEVLDCE